jgi:hypothetical protein
LIRRSVGKQIGLRNPLYNNRNIIKEVGVNGHDAPQGSANRPRGSNRCSMRADLRSISASVSLSLTHVAAIEAHPCSAADVASKIEPTVSLANGSPQQKQIGLRVAYAARQCSMVSRNTAWPSSAAPSSIVSAAPSSALR